jgi:aminoglycoside phosphotransferase family enzyme
MDLGKRGLKPHANSVLNAYLDADGNTGNLVGLAALYQGVQWKAIQHRWQPATAQ